MMRVLPGPAGKIVGEKIIYVDSPEVRQKYAEKLDALQSEFEKERAKRTKEFLELSEDLARKVAQIDHYAALVDQKIIPSSLSAKPEQNHQMEVYISKLKAEIEALTKKLNETALNEKAELGLAIRSMTQIEEEKRLIEIANIKRLPDLDTDPAESFDAFFNWRHWILFLVMLAVIFKLGMMVGKV